MNSFTKFAEKSYDTFYNDKLLGGENKYVTGYLDSIYPREQASIDGGVKVVDGIPPSLILEKGDLDLEKLSNNVSDLFTGNWDKQYYQNGLYFFARYFSGLCVFVLFYWLFAPGQMLQLWNSRSFCNTQVFGKGTQGLSLNVSVDSTYTTCESILDLGLPSSGEAAMIEYRRCEQLIRCSKRAKWGTYYTSLPSILIHGILLGFVLSLTTSLGQFIPYLDQVSSTLSSYSAFLLEWLLYVFSYPFKAALYGMEAANNSMPDIDTYLNIGMNYSKYER